MCGIAGVVYRDAARQPEARLLAAMCDVMVHRGPDERGMGVFGQAGLAMQRLSIIDVAGGQQPVGNEDGTVQVVFNGEIYNYRTLRETLEQQGHRFRTNSDTEVLVHGYEAWGEGVVERLNGMFAFALWDARARRLVLARDRTGQKPLFWHEDGERLVFGSTMAVLLAAGVPRAVNLQRLHHYLTLQYVPGPETIYAGVKKLPAAHVMVWDEGGSRQRQYWTLDYRRKARHSVGEWRELVREAMRMAVQRRLISEVPLGAFLSGGVDSSIVVALMAELSDAPVKTFSIGFDEAAFDETAHARRIAEHYGTDHHEFVVAFDDVAELLPTLARHMDEPMADSSALAVYHLARLTRAHVTVALNGDGGDEAFAGYIRYLLDKPLGVYRRVPGVVRRRVVPWAAGLIAARPDVPVETSAVAAVKRLRQASDTTAKASIVAWGSYFSHAMKQALYTDEMRAAVGDADSTDVLAAYYDAALAGSYLDRTLAVDRQTYLPGDLLVKTDRMTMAHSLEGRSPFLDHEVLELAASMPEGLKMRGLTQKWILRAAFADVLPKANTQRVKRGFSIPVGAWFRGGLGEPVRDTLLSERAMARGYFRREAVQALIDSHQARKDDHGARLWTLLMLEQWHRVYEDGA